MIDRLLARGPGGMSVPVRPVYILGVLAAVKAAGLVLIAEAIARGIAALAGGALPSADLLELGVAGAVLRAGAAWAQQGTAQRLAHGVKEQLRREALERVLADGGTTSGKQGTGALSVLLTRGLDGLDKYHTQYLPALITCAVVPLMVGARILAADWVSAVVIVVTIPLIPVFMVLIGWHTQDRTAEARASLDRLSDHLLELAKGLPALVGLGRASAQTRALQDIGAGYSRRTMETLRIAFLSSLALELISTISVAVVAVFVGVRLIHGDVGLEVGLLALILAPECYLPLRDLGAAHHASDDGLEAGRAVRAIIDAPRTPAAVPASRPKDDDDDDTDDDADDAAAGAEQLTLRFDRSVAPIVDDLTFTLLPGSITALRGPSGSGKSTLMGLLAGVPQPGLLVDGAVRPLSGQLGWVPQHPETLLDTVREELAFYAESPLTDQALLGLLAAVDGTRLLDKSTGELSPGELRRVAFARALLRIGPDGGTLLLDEPTAHVDESTSAVIRRTVRNLPPTVTVVLIAHDDRTARLAHHTVDLGSTGSLPDPRSPARTPDQGGNDPGLRETPLPAPAPSGLAAPMTNYGTVRTALNALALVRPWSPRFLAALAFGTGSSAFAVALTALSGWLIVRASEQPPILYLLAAIVGVRFFGIGRSLLRYCERLWLHGSILQTADAVRLRLWQALLGRAEAWRSLSRGSGGIERLVGDIDELRDTAARAVFPPLTALLTGLAAIGTTALLLPDAIPWQIFAVGIGLLAAPAAALLAERSAGAAGMTLRAASLAQTTSLLRASQDVAVNGLTARALARLAQLESRAARGLRRSSWAAGIGQALVISACVLAAVAILAGSAGQSAEVVAVVVLMQLALIEPLAAGVTAVQQWAPLGTVTRRLDDHLEPKGATAGPMLRRNLPEPALGEDPPALALVDAAVGYEPGVAVVEGVTLAVRSGSWTALTGASGSGKSTLIGALLGFLPLNSGRYLAAAAADGGVLPAAWCPQEGHLFDSSIRANLLLACAPQEPADDDELWRILHAVGLADTVRARTGGLDTRIGPGGNTLSGGERQRLAVARALLTRAPVLILDEPTAHLDADGASRLLRDLRRGLGDRPVLLVTHDRAEALSCDTGVELAAGRKGNHLSWEHAYA
ncbi:thiol reductant ABC exporter subunit CydD [Arthrobacter tumbae]|uniref:thiol reductant ABC exporter subunit CydD n=1 Tax=Arthrobacter tumbae TaxID=163874 RepID=UPI0027DB24BA|nr:thiol reductant ABC exporter subunit CydD [Arthrobacter tumbae]MBM7782904.1 ATP-binding cassette subfamily C protein CydCD [Arthrobacter tumbae]